MSDETTTEKHSPAVSFTPDDLDAVRYATRWSSDERLHAVAEKISAHLAARPPAEGD